MLLLSPIVIYLQWNEQYIYAIFSGNFGIPNKNIIVVNLLDCKPP